MADSFRLGTRGSPLALIQAGMVRDALMSAHGWPDVEIVVIRTTGDRVQDRALAEIGGKALWTKELDRALLAGEVDACVHSMKDVETIRPRAIAIAAMLERADVRDSDDPRLKATSELLGKGWTENAQRTTAAIKWSWLREHAAGLIALSGADLGAVGQALLMGDRARAAHLARELAAIFPGRFFIELQRAGHTKGAVDHLPGDGGRAHASPLNLAWGDFDRAAVALLAGAASGLACGINDRILWYPGADLPFTAVYITSTTISGAVIAGLGGWLLMKALASTGALSRFASGREATARV